MSRNPTLNLKRPHIADIEWLEEKIDSLPKEKITSNIVETAERVRVLPKTSPFPGKYKFSRSSYMYEIAMELSPQSSTEVINIMKAGQMGATAGSSENLVLFKISEDPGPVLAMVPTNEFLKKWDESRIMPMIDSSGLKDKLKSSYKKNTQHGGKGDAVGRKAWPGGKLDIITFAQLNQLRNQSYQVVIIEDAEELVMTSQKGGGQGDVKKVAFIRTNTFSGRRKILDISTPILLQNSHIHREFLKGDQRFYYIECPKCHHSQQLLWKHLKYEKNEHGHVIEDSVYYECQAPKCNYHMKEEEKQDFLLCEELGGTAKWIPHNAEKAEPLTKSYQFSALYAGPGFDTWYQLAKEWVAAQGDAEAMQAFVNLRLGEPFSDYSDAPPAETLHVLKGTYRQEKHELPNESEGKPLFAMLSCDIQAGNKRDGKFLKGKESRIEASLWGFGLNNRSWLLGHYIIKGETEDYRSGAFRTLKEMLTNEVFPMTPIRTLIDAGYQTEEVKRFCNRATTVYPVMGESKIKKGWHRVDLTGYMSGTGGPLPMYEMNNDGIKRTIYNRVGVLRRDPLTGAYPSGYMMFPFDLEAKYFEQLTSERPEPIQKNGRIVGYKFVAHGANEALDCTSYAFMGLQIYIEEMSLTRGYGAANHRSFWDWAANHFKNSYPSPKELAERREKLIEILYNKIAA